MPIKISHIPHNVRQIVLVCGSAYILNGCSLQVPVKASYEPASKIVPSRVSQIPISYYFGEKIAHLKGKTYIQQLALILKPGKAIEKTLSDAILAEFPNAEEGKALQGKLYHISFYLNNFDPEFSLDRSFFDINDTLSSRVSISVVVNIQDRNFEPIYRGIIYGENSKTQNRNPAHTREQLESAADSAIQRLGDNFTQKILYSSLFNRSW